jgi:hypothetical protein
MCGTDEFDAPIGPGHFRDDRRRFVDATVVNDNQFNVAAEPVQFLPDVVECAEDPCGFVKGGDYDRQDRRTHRSVEGSTRAVP